MNKVLFFLFRMILICSILFSIFGCGTFIIEDLGPHMPEAENISSLGIMLFSPYINYAYGADNPFSVIVAAPGEDLVLKLARLSHEMIPVMESKQIFQQSSVSKENLNVLSQLAFDKVLSGRHEYHMQLVKGFADVHIMSSKNENGVQFDGIKNIVRIPETAKGMLSFSDMEYYKNKYNIDSILAGNVTVYAKIYKATDIRVEETTGLNFPDFKKDEYVLFLDAVFTLTVYDTDSKKQIAFLQKEELEYGPLDTAEKKFYPLPVQRGYSYDLERYMESREFETLVLDLLTEEASIYAYMFLPHSDSHFE